MASSRRLTRNIVANVAQTLLSALPLLVLYRYVNSTLGVESLGVWSVVLATASAANLANLGLVSGVVRFVARDRSRQDFLRAAQVVDTAALTLTALVVALMPLLYAGLSRLLPHLFQTEHLDQALAILPYALASLSLSMVAAVFQGGLDGCERMDLRATLFTIGQILVLPLAFWLVPRNGLVGLAWAQIGQGGFLVVGGRLLLRRALPTLPLLPVRWRGGVLREMLCYGANIQAATLLMLLLDPTAKALMAHFGGPAAAGYFEMANQVVLKVRALIVAANQAVVPHAVWLAETAPDRLAVLYRQNLRVLVFAVLPAFTLLFAWAGAVSWLMTGAYSAEFVSTLGLLSLAWGANIFCAPAYFINLGSGRVGWNTVAHLIHGSLNAGLGWTLGGLYGARGVIAAYMAALIAGSAGLILAFERRNGLAMGADFANEHATLLAACAVWIAFGVYALLQPAVGRFGALALPQFFGSLAVLAVAVWFHPLRREFWLRAASGANAL